MKPGPLIALLCFAPLHITMHDRARLSYGWPLLALGLPDRGWSGRGLLGLLLALLLGLPSAYAEPLGGALLPDSVVEYEIRDGTGEIVGRAPVAALDLHFDDEDMRDIRLAVMVESTAFSSGNAIRDSNARRTVFDAREFPTITFEGVRVNADPVDLPEGSTRTLLVDGRLTLHGVERELEVPIEIARVSGRLIATGTFEVLLSDYGMTRPSFLFLVVEDRVVIRFRIEAELRPLAP